MAGVTREAKAAQERLPDRISLGVLARTFPAPVLDEVVEAAGVREVRYRRLPARLMVVFTLACWLFMRSGYGVVLSKLADAHALDDEGWGHWQAPWTGSISKAKAKLGAKPFKLLFARTAVPVGTPDTPGVFHAGLRVATVDGFTLDLPDTDDNGEFFGRGGNGSGEKNPYPQLRALALAESGTRVLLAATYGPSGAGEQTLAEDLLPAMGAGMLVLADRNFASWKLWRAAAATGAQLCWRMSASFRLPVLQVLPDGTYISELRPPRKKDGPPIRVRVIEYTVVTTDANGEEHSELFALATTLLDVDTYPAIDLAQLYHLRWQAEEDFQVGKDQFGLDHSQVRLYPALLRHLALAMTALAVCATSTAAMRPATSTLPPPPTSPDQAPPADPGLIPLTVAETRRLLNLLTRTWHTRAHHLHWNWWRRRHQARARWFHQRARLRRDTA